jgi:serine/threonine protein kinase
VTWVSDDAMARLGALPELPDFSGTRYRLLSELDRGGMGVVYSAEDLTLGREVAIKVPREGLARNGAAGRLERESAIMARLEHPGIVPVHDAGTLPDGRAFYVMKRVRGTRIDALARSTLSLSETLRLFTRICEPIAFAHARGVVHRDLKPENVMVGEFGEVLVMDWGVAKRLGRPSEAGPEGAGQKSGGARVEGAPLSGVAHGAALTADGDVVGTRGYMAPEQERGDTGAISPRSDVWALGAILRELATAAGTSTRTGLPKPLAAIVARAMAPEPAHRYASAAELAADVVRFVDDEGVTAYREAPWEKGIRWLRRNRAAVGVVAAYLVMRTAIYLWFGR